MSFLEWITSPLIRAFPYCGPIKFRGRFKRGKMTGEMQASVPAPNCLMNSNNHRTGRSVAAMPLTWILLAVAGGIATSYMLRKPRAPYSFRDKVVIITGGSRGLGLLMARELAAEGAQLILLARPQDELQRAEEDLGTRGAFVATLPCDVRNREQVQQAIKQVVGHFGRIDVLINNAGIMQVGPLAHMTLEDFENSMAVHFFGPLYTTLASLPYMREAGGGRIVNISSIGGRVAIPHMLPYVASKFALAGFSEGLATELRRENIFVTTVYPSPMRTGSPPNAQFKGKYKNEYAWFSLMDSLPLLSTSGERAAHKIIHACRRGSSRLALGVQTKAAILLNDLFPGATTRLLSLANKLMPSADPDGGTDSHLGWESQSQVSPSVLTRLSDEATARNNERPVILK